MREFVFAVDCDEVLRDNIETMINVYNEDYQEKLKPEDFFDYKVEKVFPKIEADTGMTASQYFFEHHAKEVFTDAKALPGAKEAIDKLRKYGKVIIVTYQKNTENRQRTVEWLDTNGIEYDGLCFLRDKTIVHADYLIDDNDWNFNGCNCNHGILITKPYNTDVNLGELRAKSNCKTMDKFSSLSAFADWFEGNIEIFEKYEY